MGRIGGGGGGGGGGREGHLAGDAGGDECVKKALAENGDGRWEEYEHLPCFPGAQLEQGRFDLTQTHDLHLALTSLHLQQGLEDSCCVEDKGDENGE